MTGDTTGEGKDELKTRIMGHYASQNRAITKEDYIATVYKMDPRYGAVKRCNVMKDFDSDRRNINLYLMSTDENNHLAAPTATLKQNVKNWLLAYKPINDTVDILEGVIANYGLDYSVIIDDNYDKNEVVAQANRILGAKLGTITNFGQSLFLGDIFRDLVVKVEGLLDVVEIQIVNKIGDFYSTSFFDIEGHLSKDGRYLMVPEDTILELKYPDRDIRGAVI